MKRMVKWCVAIVSLIAASVVGMAYLGYRKECKRFEDMRDICGI